jgi:hypothetical protein
MHVASSVNALTGALSSWMFVVVISVYLSIYEPGGTTAAYTITVVVRPTTSWLSINNKPQLNLKSTKQKTAHMSSRPSKRPARGTTTRSKTPMPTTATSPPPAKRRRTASLEADLLTPPLLDEEVDPLSSRCNVVSQSDSDDFNDSNVDDDEDLFSHAAHVLATEAAALASITALYRTSATAKKNLKSAVETILHGQQSRGKLIVSGVGKSAYIGQKLVATCKSMGVATSFMHACEAAHGDLGDIRDVSLKSPVLEHNQK